MLSSYKYYVTDHFNLLSNVIYPITLDLESVLCDCPLTWQIDKIIVVKLLAFVT